MKKIIPLITGIIISTTTVFASVSTDYLENLYSCQYDTKVNIKSKKEIIDKYEQKIGDNFISCISYGYADMKIKGKKKMRVSYICLLENDSTPIWGYIIPR